MKKKKKKGTFPMTVDDVPKGVIFVSPDGGETVFIQKKNGEIEGFIILVFIAEIPIIEPSKYAPLSPRNISAFGKYWYNEGIGERTDDGHFVDFTLNINNIQFSDSFLLHIYPEIFYFNFTGNIDGLSLANKIEISNSNFPVSLTAQIIFPIWTNMPDLGTELSFGIVTPLN